MADPKLSILAFPQKIQGNELFFHVLVVPRNIDPFQPWAETGAPAWVDADLQLRAHVMKGLDGFPAFGSTAALYSFTQEGIPPQAGKMFEKLQQQFNIVPAPPGSERRLQKPKPADYAKKYLPFSYRNSFNFTRPRTKDAVTDDSYFCAIKENPKPDPAFQPSSNELSWGEVFAYCLRKPALAEKLGFIHKGSITLQPGDLEEGGWLFFDTDPAGSYSTAADLDFIKVYAARLPKIDNNESRPLFAPILFPVKNAPADSDPVGFDEIFPEAATYDDGFAKIVHANQPVSSDLLRDTHKNEEEDDTRLPIHDVGIRLAWEDEQILIWLNRQLRADPNDPTGSRRLDAPLGVFRYRIDVKKNNDGEWSSLCLLKNNMTTALDPSDPETVIETEGTVSEQGVDVYPSRPDAGPNTHYWLPPYFVNWVGKPLVIPDKDAADIYLTKEAGAGVSDIYESAIENDIKLEYGNTYHFRVRMSDTTGGGPGWENDPLNEPVYEGPAVTTSCAFKRYVVPSEVEILSELPKTDDTYFDQPQLEIVRPRLGYPSVVFTGKYGDAVIDLLKADRDEAIQFVKDPVTNMITKKSREIGLRDPDVQVAEIKVEVKTLAMDQTGSENGNEPYVLLYKTTRNFPDDFNAALNIPVIYRDAHVLQFNGSSILQDLGLSSEADPENINDMEALVLPTGRDIRITVRAVCHNDLNYFGADKYRYGKPVSFFARKASENEQDLFKSTGILNLLRGIYLQPSHELPVAAVNLKKNFLMNVGKANNDLVQRLAEETDLQCLGFSLMGKPGRRVQLGCSKDIRNNLSPDGCSITFSTRADLSGHWIVPLTLILDRDWTWDALKPVSFRILRKKWFTSKSKPAAYEHAGDIELKKIVSIPAGRKPDRTQTWLVFLDAVDPKPDKGDFLDTVELEYKIEANFKEDHGNLREEDPVLQLKLPVTTNPAQIPEIVSSGIALSKYTRNETYSRTDIRAKYLWLEFREPIADPNDSIFVRVLGYAPDPLLAQWRADHFIVPKESELPIDPEIKRVISPGQPEDNSGLNAMQEMTSVSADGRHFIVPLPPGLHADSPELFGFFTYEIRIGHRHIWSTAQGRFGRELRVTGVQHPYPHLLATVYRNEQYIKVSAPYAKPVSKGRNVTPIPPRTQMWCLLYAQVLQADGKDYRNILLDDRLLQVRKRVEDINNDAPVYAEGGWYDAEVKNLLRGMNLPADSPLSVLCVEMFPDVLSLLNNGVMSNRSAAAAREERAAAGGEDTEMMRRLEKHIVTRYQMMQDSTNEGMDERAAWYSAAGNYFRPLTDHLGHHRILRTSPLVPVPDVCCEECKTD